MESQIVSNRNMMDEPGIDFENDMQDVLHDLLNDFDPEGFGEIPWADFLSALNSPEFQSEVDPKKRELLAEKAEQSKTNAITFQDFVNVMTGKRTRSFKIAVHHRDREVWSETDFHLIIPETSLIRRMVKWVAEEFLPDDQNRKYYVDNYTCCPPPLFVIIITLIEIGFFTFYTVNFGQLDTSTPVVVDSLFIYRPDKRTEIWRFLFYVVLHTGWLHLTFNILVQVMVGIPLEMIHGSLRIVTVYLAGVLAGSLGTSVFDGDVYLMGASGGVYALLTAHLSNIILKYNQMRFGLARLVGIFLIASADVGFAVYNRYASEHNGPPVSYVAHLSGALVGLSIGLVILKNFEQKLNEQWMWWVALSVYAVCIIFAILFNVFNY